MEPIVVYPKTKKQIAAFESLAAAFGISIETKEKSPYKKDFVKRIRKSEQEFNDGKFISVKKEDIDKFIDML